MTLIAGIRCRDGYIVASDTAITTGVSVTNGRKIDHYIGEDYRLIVACSGDIAHAKMLSQKLRDRIASIEKRTFLRAKAVIDEIVLDFYAAHIGAVYLQAQHAPYPRYNLILSLECEGLHALFATNEDAVFEVDSLAFRGSGEEVAHFLAQKLLIDRRSMIVPLLTSEAVHIVQHIFKTAKSAADGVGGNTEILARLTAPEARRFFTLNFAVEDTALNDFYLWSIEDHITRCIWSALRTSEFEKHLKNAEGILSKLREASRQRHEITSRTMHLLEQENGEWSASFDDGHPSVPWPTVSQAPLPPNSPEAVPM